MTFHEFHHQALVNWYEPLGTNDPKYRCFVYNLFSKIVPAMGRNMIFFPSSPISATSLRHIPVTLTSVIWILAYYREARVYHYPFVVIALALKTTPVDRDSAFGTDLRFVITSTEFFDRIRSPNLLRSHLRYMMYMC